jgi:hypothetical protein
MPEATSNHTTISPTRRRFLSNAAGIAAGSAVLFGAATVTGPAVAKPLRPRPNPGGHRSP